MQFDCPPAITTLRWSDNFKTFSDFSFQPLLTPPRPCYKNIVMTRARSSLFPDLETTRQPAPLGFVCKLQFLFNNQQLNPQKWVRFEHFAFTSPYGK